MAQTDRQIIQAQEDGRVFIDMPDESPCSSCGACCSNFRISFYFGELDAAPGGFVPDGLATKLNDFRACMKGTETGGRCVALRGEIGKGPISCDIYANRPTPCREYPVWEMDGSPNPSCQALRARVGLAPLSAKTP